MTWVWLDGRLMPEDRATVPVAGAASLTGRGVFETFRVKRKQLPYRFDRHMDRLEGGARQLSIVLSARRAEIGQAVICLAEQCGLEDARVRVTLLARAPHGEAYDGSLLIQARAATDYTAEMYERGVSAVVSDIRRNASSPLSRIKSVNCLDNLLARVEARRQGGFEALLLNTRGHIAEGSMTNIFLVASGTLFTPPIKGGALPGITRAAVIELAGDAGIGLRETSLTLDDLLSAEEAFLTNAVAGLLPLVRVGGRPIGRGAPGSATGHLHALYAQGRP